MAEQTFRSFEEFWAHYVREHSHPLNRTLHFIGSSLALGLLTGAALGHLYLLPAAAIVGYGFAWFGHFFVEKNKPASFNYPLWSFKADWVMWFKTLTGTMRDEVHRIIGHDGPLLATR